MDATAQAELVRRGDASPTELVEDAIARIEKLNPELNAVVIPLYDKARYEAERAPDGPFRGVPYLLKDLTLVTRGDPTNQSIAGVKASGYRADHDSYYVERMRAAGFVLVGKTNLPEMGMAPTTEPLAWGPARNPWDPSRSTGGSSGGSAAAVAAGMVSIAHANDGGGSARMPAGYCGVIGMKASRGRVSAGPAVNASDEVSGLASEACVARSVRDVARLLEVVSGHRPGDAYYAPPPLRPFTREVGVDPGRLRIGVLMTDPSESVAVDPECASGVRGAADALARLGHEVRDAFPDALRQGAWSADYVSAVSVLVKREIDRFGRRIGRALTAADLEPATWAFAEQASQVSGEQYARGVDSLRVRARQIETWWEDDGWDLLVTPTTPIPAPPLGATTNPDDPLFTSIEASTVFTVPFNISGQPAISLPLHSTADGLPVGVQLVAAYGREDLLLRVASQLEDTVPWSERRPAISA